MPCFLSEYGTLSCIIDLTWFMNATWKCDSISFHITYDQMYIVQHKWFVTDINANVHWFSSSYFKCCTDDWHTYTANSLAATTISYAKPLMTKWYKASRELYLNKPYKKFPNEFHKFISLCAFTTNFSSKNRIHLNFPFANMRN